MFGYFVFVITAAFFVGLTLFTTSQPSLVGDNAMGYGLGLFFFGVGFAFTSLILTIVVNTKGGFDWVGQFGGMRTVLVFLAWLLVAATTFFCAMFKWEWHNNTLYPAFLHAVAVRHGQVWIPLFWLVSCFLSLQSTGQSSVSPTVLKISFWIGASLSAVFSSGLLVGYVRESVESSKVEAARQAEDSDRWHRENLAQVLAQKPEDPIINLLGFTSRYQYDDIRKAAVEKIKTHPNWEAEILALLQFQRGAQEVYYFLDGYPVEHPRQFAEPLNQSILELAATIKATIADSNNLQSWSFDSYGIEQLLRALDDHFGNQGVNFYPAVVKLQQALKTPLPDRFKGVRFTVTGTVDQWLATHKNLAK